MTDEAEKAYEAMIDRGAKAMRPECWEPEHMKVYDDLWMREERDKLRSKFRAAAEAIGLKPGSVVVPMEPTPEMNAHMQHAAKDWISDDLGLIGARSLYQIMIAAALPRQPEKEGA